MANNNITNVNNIRTKEIFYDLPTTAFVPTNNAITSATLDATGKSIIKIFNNGANFVFYGMAGGVHGKVV
jgi:hypothetical protein